MINADVSQPALDTAKFNAELNGFDISKKRAVFLNADVFKLLREYRDQGTRFDVVVMDPPSLPNLKPSWMVHAAAIKTSTCWPCRS